MCEISFSPGGAAGAHQNISERGAIHQALVDSSNLFHAASPKIPRNLLKVTLKQIRSAALVEHSSGQRGQARPNLSGDPVPSGAMASSTDSCWCSQAQG